MLRNVIKLERRPSPQERFSRLIEPHFDALYKAARRMTLSPHDAEDLVQETCIKAFDQLGAFERIEFQRAWLLRILYNKFIDSTRSDGRSPVHIAGTGEESGEPELLATNAISLDELVDREQQIARVLQAMRCLESDNCALVAMHDVEGLSIRELCELTGMPAGTIKARLHRTRTKLGKLLSNDAVTRPHLRVVGGEDE